MPEPEPTKLRPATFSQSDAERTQDHLPATESTSVGNGTSRSDPDRTREHASGECLVDHREEIVPGFELLGELGRGGMGVVYKARQTKLNRIVALKMILSGGHAGKKDLIRFLAEAESIAAVKHANVVQVFEYGESDGRPFMALEFCAGGSLVGRLAKFGGRPVMSQREAAELVGKVARGVSAAHALGIVHRDLKPANVLLDLSGEPKVTDFGLAKRESSEDLTGTNAVMGTPAYMSPEQARGDTKFVGPQADVWALGVILYECLTGLRPFAGGDSWTIIRSVIEREPARPRRHIAGIAPDLELICMKCLAKSPHERYGTAKELADDLERWRNGEPVTIRRTGPVERVAKWVRRNPTLASAYALTAVSAVLVAIVIGAVRLMNQAESARGIAKLAQEDAERAQAVADREREKFERFEYGRTIEVAHQEHIGDGTATAIQLIEQTRPELRGWEWKYLNRLFHSELKTFPFSDTDTPWKAWFSEQDTSVYAMGLMTKVRAWSVADGTVRFEFDPGEPYRPRDVRIAGENRLALCGKQNSNYIAVWNMDANREVLQLKHSGGAVYSAVFSPDGAKIATEGVGPCRIWDAKSGSELFALKHDGENILQVAFNRDASRILTIGLDGALRIWDGGNGKPQLAIRPDGLQISCMALSPDERRIATGTREGPIVVWDAKNGSELTRFGRDGAYSRCVAWNGDGTRILSCGSNTARIWDAKSGAELNVLKGHTAGINACAFSQSGTQVLTGSSDGTLKIWDASNPVEPHDVCMRGHSDLIWMATMSQDGSKVATHSADRTMRIWDAKSGRQLKVLKVSPDDVPEACFSPDGKTVLTAGRTVRIWDVLTGTPIRTYSGSLRDILGAVYSADGRRLLTTCRDKTARIWDVETGEELVRFQGHSGHLSSARFNHDESRVVTGSEDNSARVWNVSNGQELLQLNGHVDGRARSFVMAAFSPDGRRIATSGGDNVIKLWDATTGENLITMKGHTNHVHSVEFSPDGSRILTSSPDGTARLWDPISGAEVLSLKGHATATMSAVFSPDGTRILTAGADKTAKIWDTRPRPAVLPR